jgi:hypothetical protein
MMAKNGSNQEAGEWSSQSETNEAGQIRQSKQSTVQKKSLSHLTPQKSQYLNDFVRSQNKKTNETLIGADFNQNVNGIDSVETNKIWYSNTKDHAQKSNLLEDNINFYKTTFKEKRGSRVVDQGESENHFSARRLQPKNLQQSLGKKSIQEKNELNIKNE